MRRTIQKHTIVNTLLFLRGKLIYLVIIFCSLVFPAQLYISDSTIITNIHEIHVVKLDTPVVVSKNNVSKNRKLKPKSVIDAKIIEQVKLKAVNPPDQFYRNNTSNYFVYRRGKSQEAITPTTQSSQWIALLHNIDLHYCFTDDECSNLTKYKENNTISFFDKITLARPPPQ
ncbi:hypothetical protein [Chryseobacterium indoltheticum]|uniref:Uncharacterized protein n=1 Tax=Chryseobacterium indoltheticum TaxID=254 RepID=A0A381FG68_9FLAO|nr:hypothetical protein [Chryseobacterium indoltheticum]SUX45483.1 Uncharacterised protein [Chryseobacterium indoltheticum]